MYMPNYKFSENVEIQSTQKVLRTVASNNRLGLVVTLLAAAADLSLIANYMSQVNIDTFTAVVASIMIVLGLDISMLVLATRINSAQLTKDGLRSKKFIAVSFLSIFCFCAAYFVFCLIVSGAAKAEIAASSANATDNNFRYLLPLVTSLVSFVASVDYAGRRAKIDELKDAKFKLEQDIRSAKNYVAMYERVSRELDTYAYDRQSMKLALESLKNSAIESEICARISLAEELGSEEAASALLAKANLLSSEFWENLSTKGVELVDKTTFIHESSEPVTARNSYTLPWLNDA